MSTQGQTWLNPTAQTAAASGSTSSSNRKRLWPQRPATWAPANQRRPGEEPAGERSHPWPIWRRRWWVRTACCRCAPTWWEMITPCCTSTCPKEDTPCPVSHYLLTLCSHTHSARHTLLSLPTNCFLSTQVFLSTCSYAYLEEFGFNVKQFMLELLKRVSAGILGPSGRFLNGGWWKKKLQKITITVMLHCYSSNSGQSWVFSTFLY